MPLFVRGGQYGGIGTGSDGHICDGERHRRAFFVFGPCGVGRIVGEQRAQVCLDEEAGAIRAV